MTKTRMITIQRTVKEIVEDKKGNVKEQFVKHWFPVRINAAVPYDHHMCQ